MYIFGGDRHLMAFNDLYAFDLEKGLTSIDLYRSNWFIGNRERGRDLFMIWFVY